MLFVHFVDEYPDAVVIEDSFNGIRAAHRAGMIPVMVPDMLEPDEEMIEAAIAAMEGVLEDEGDNPYL